MNRGKLFRHRDRASYKASEVLGLFLISLFLGMALFGILALVDYAFRLAYVTLGYN